MPSAANPNANPNAHTVDADSFHPKDNDDNADNKAGGEQKHDAAAAALPLPAPGEGSAEALTLQLGADGVKLDALGPMVVNTDGSLSRIANWERMAEIERRNTLRE
ncbi:hypothetical protein SLS58_009337 [Diplodia intermedia]|uniref:Uncharacterized protein n=1 Tax=Diplodia intermedia TaxID=856260 RepID=A0ABR3TCS4_9PEZI